VVWWDKAFYAQEEAALHETIAAFEQETDYIGQWAFDDQFVDLSATSRTCSIRMRSPG
jgi:hypothetical protein